VLLIIITVVIIVPELTNETVLLVIMNVYIVYVPELLNIIPVELPFVSLMHVITEDRSAPIMCNSDTSSGTPPILVLLVSMVITFLLMKLVLYSPGVSCVVNRRGSSWPMYSGLLQERIN
jgi:hypothetical protein